MHNAITVADEHIFAILIPDHTVSNRAEQCDSVLGVRMFGQSVCMLCVSVCVPVYKRSDRLIRVAIALIVSLERTCSWIGDAWAPPEERALAEHNALRISNNLVHVQRPFTSAASGSSFSSPAAKHNIKSLEKVSDGTEKQ